MRAMLYADWMNLRHSIKSMVFLVVVFALTGFFFSGPMFFTMIVVMLSITVPITLCSVDKAYGWDRLSMSMPILRRDMVGSKFLLSLLTSAAALALSILLSAVYSAVHADAAFLEAVAVLLFSEAAAIVLMGVILVTTVKWGVEKARYIMLACVWIPILLAFLVRKIGLPLPDLSVLNRISNAQLCLVALAVIVVSLLIYLACCLLAVHVYQKTEL